MPRGNRTGPMGMGPMSGRGAGYCGGSGVAGFENRYPGGYAGTGFGRNFARGGRGGGFGWRNMFRATGLPRWMRYGGYHAPQPTVDAASEKQALKHQADALQSELDLIKKRLSELESESSPNV